MKGTWSGPAWEQADTLEIANFRPESSDHRPRTCARLLYGSDGLFGIFLVKDRYVRCVHTHYMDPVYEELHTAIFVDGIHIMCVYASHVPVPNQEDTEDPISIIEQSGIGPRTMVTTLRAKVGDF